MSNAQNGARIKVFGGSNDTHSVSGGGSGYVRNVTFQDFVNNSKHHLIPTEGEGLGCRRGQPDLSDSMLFFYRTAVSLTFLPWTDLS